MGRLLQISNKGQILLEVLVALGIAVIVVTSITSIVVASLSQAQSSQNQNKATAYAQQGMEIMKNMRNSGWTSFASLSGTYCLDSGCTSITSASQSNPNCWVTPPACNKIENTFTRTVTTNLGNATCNNAGVKVVVDVKWNDGKCSSSTDLCHKSEQTSCLFNINTVPSPGVNATPTP